MAASGTVVIDVELSPAAARREALAHAIEWQHYSDGATTPETLVAAAKVFEKYLTGDQS